jgi:hypothetical protein
MGHSDAISAQIRAEVHAEIWDTVKRHKAHGDRLTLAELAELEKKHRALTLKLADYRQSWFSLNDLHNAVQDAGYEMGEHGGDPAVCFAQFSDKRLIEQDRTDFIVDLAQACPRYAHSIMRAAQWSDGACCFWWCARELREAA